MPIAGKADPNLWSRFKYGVFPHLVAAYGSVVLVQPITDAINGIDPDIRFNRTLSEVLYSITLANFSGRFREFMGIKYKQIPYFNIWGELGIFTLMRLGTGYIKSKIMEASDLKNPRMLHQNPEDS